MTSELSYFFWTVVHQEGLVKFLRIHQEALEEQGIDLVEFGEWYYAIAENLGIDQ